MMMKKWGWLGALLLLATAPTAQAGHGGGMDPDGALSRLLEGNRRFIDAAPSHPNQDVARRALLAGGQEPFAIILCCSDSRVPPEVVFDQGLGDLFVVRVAGNVADEIGLASIEYAAEHLGVRLVMVLGHERCGAVTAAVKGGELPGHLPALMAALQPAVDGNHDPHGDAVEGAMQANIELTARHLRESGPVLSGLVAEGQLKVVGARYDLDTGAVTVVDAGTGHDGVSPEEALARLIIGNRHFVNAKPAFPGQDAARRDALIEGQAPFAAILSCSDSRVAPEVLFDQGLGDLFVVRVAGNVANAIGIASLEYAAEHLGTRLIVVLGHERCGAVTAAVGGGELPGHLPALMTALQPAVAANRDPHGDPVEGAIRANVELTAELLRESGPILAEMVEKGELKIVGARYDLDTGIVEWLDGLAGPGHGAAAHAVAPAARPSHAPAHAAKPAAKPSHAPAHAAAPAAHTATPAAHAATPAAHAPAKATAHDTAKPAAHAAPVAKPGAEPHGSTHGR
jgi:carbonic anhydrase